MLALTLKTGTTDNERAENEKQNANAQKKQKSYFLPRHRQE
jgi:hypothetical protein